MQSPQGSARTQLAEESASFLGESIPLDLLGAELIARTGRRIHGVVTAANRLTEQVRDSNYTAALSSWHSALTAIENAKPRPAPIVPVAPARALLRDGLRLDVADTTAGANVRLGASRVVCAEMERSLRTGAFDGELTPRLRLVAAASIGVVLTDELLAYTGPLAAPRALMTKVDPLWLSNVAKQVGVATDVPPDQKRRAVIDVLDRMLPALGKQQAWLCIYWVLELRRHCADSALVEGLPDAVFAGEAFIELVGRHLASVSPASAAASTPTSTTSHAGKSTNGASAKAREARR